MLWISCTSIGLLVVLIGMAFSLPPWPSPAQVTVQVTVAVMVAPATGVVHSTPQSGGAPGPVAGACPAGKREPPGPQLLNGVPAVAVMTGLPAVATTVTDWCPIDTVTKRFPLATLAPTKVARLTKPVVAGLVVTVGARTRR